MSEFKGTPAPWYIMKGGFTKKGDGPDMAQIYATNNDLEMICKVYKDEILHNKVQNFLANSKLIACAPDMLNLLEYFLEQNMLSVAGELLAEELIKKATII